MSRDVIFSETNKTTPTTSQRVWAGNNVFCVYNAESEDIIKEHAELAGVPANEITLISSIL
jgi:hypothetical protein